MPDQPSVGVIIPAHNSAMTIVRALDSVYAQTDANIVEVIVVDDGSTDNTAQIVREKFPQVTLITQPNSGVSAARNAGMERATAELLAFLDADDEWLPEKLAEQVRYAVASPGAALLMCQEITVPFHGPPQRCAERDGLLHFTFRDWLKGRPLAAGVSLSCSGWLFRRDALKELGGFDESCRHCNDIELVLRTTARGYLTAITPRALFVRHMQKQSVSQGPKSVIKRARMICQLIRRYEPDEAAMLTAAEYEQALQYYLTHLLYHLLLDGEHAEAAEVAREARLLRGPRLSRALIAFAAVHPRLAARALRCIIHPLRSLRRGM